MDTVFSIKNQLGLYLNKHREWVNGADNQSLFRTPHKDEALNTVFEVSSHDIYLRAEVIACELDEKGQPIVEITAEQPTPALPDDVENPLPA